MVSFAIPMLPSYQPVAKVRETTLDLRHKMTLWRWERNRLQDDSEGCGWRRNNCPGVRVSLLRAIESGPGESRFRRLRGRAVRPVLRRRDRAAESAARTVLPDAVGRVLRGIKLGTGHRLASGGFDEPARFSGLGPGGDAAESLDLVAHSAKDRRDDVGGGDAQLGAPGHGARL